MIEHMIAAGAKRGTEKKRHGGVLPAGACSGIGTIFRPARDIAGK
jgi:hypothetical protein